MFKTSVYLGRKNARPKDIMIFETSVTYNYDRGTTQIAFKRMPLIGFKQTLYINVANTERFYLLFKSFFPFSSGATT